MWPGWKNRLNEVKSLADSLIVVGIAAAIVLLEKLVLSAVTPFGARVWRVLTVMMWTTASLILGSSCIAMFLEQGLPDSNGPPLELRPRFSRLLAATPRIELCVR